MDHEPLKSASFEIHISSLVHPSKIFVWELRYRFGLRIVENSIENPHFIFCSSFQNLRLARTSESSTDTIVMLSSSCHVYRHIVHHPETRSCELDMHIVMRSSSRGFSSCYHHLDSKFVSWTYTSSCYHHEMSSNAPAYHGWLARTLFNTDGAMVFL